MRKDEVNGQVWYNIDVAEKKFPVYINTNQVGGLITVEFSKDKPSDQSSLIVIPSQSSIISNK